MSLAAFAIETIASFLGNDFDALRKCCRDCYTTLTERVVRYQKLTWGKYLPLTNNIRKNLATLEAYKLTVPYLSEYEWWLLSQFRHNPTTERRISQAKECFNNETLYDGALGVKVSDRDFEFRSCNNGNRLTIKPVVPYIESEYDKLATEKPAVLYEETEFLSPSEITNDREEVFHNYFPYNRSMLLHIDKYLHGLSDYEYITNKEEKDVNHMMHNHKTVEKCRELGERLRKIYLELPLIDVAFREGRIGEVLLMLYLEGIPKSNPRRLRMALVRNFAFDYQPLPNWPTYMQGNLAIAIAIQFEIVGELKIISLLDPKSRCEFERSGLAVQHLLFHEANTFTQHLFHLKGGRKTRDSQM